MADRQIRIPQSLYDRLMAHGDDDDLPAKVLEAILDDFEKVAMALAREAVSTPQRPPPVRI